MNPLNLFLHLLMTYSACLYGITTSNLRQGGHHSEAKLITIANKHLG